jgi:hypothetical protein
MPDLLSGNTQSQGNVLVPGIIGLFVQGIETGLVLSQLSVWFSLPEQTESLFLTIATLFVTSLGLWVIRILHILVP